MSFAGEPPLFEHYRSCTTGRALFESLKEQLVDETLAKQECALIMQYFDRAVRSEFKAMQAKDQQDDDADDDDVDMGGETNANSARKRGGKSKGKGKASKTKKKRQVFDTKISGELNRRQALSGVANIFVKHMRIEPTSRTSQVADDVEAEWCKFVAMDAKPLQAKKRGRRRG